MLSKDDIERISSLWTPSEWPDSLDAKYASVGQRNPFSYYAARVRHLGLFGDTLVDAGCGVGRWAFALATVFDHVIGIDKSAVRIATAQWLRERFAIPQTHFMIGDILQIPLGDNSVNTVYSNSVAMGGISISEIFSESFRILKPGGIFYIGLNGFGYGYRLVEHRDPSMAEWGRQRVYSTYCQSVLRSLPAKLYPGGRLNEVARAQLAAAAGPAEFLIKIGGTAAQIAAANAIATDLGPELAKQLMNEFEAITEGGQTIFSRPRAGRDYEPREIVETALLVGFDRVEWAPDGCLSLGSDGSIMKTPCPEARPYPPEFKGRLNIFEALMWKPEAKPAIFPRATSDARC
jgi:SAM-dependent methyltransferase